MALFGGKDRGNSGGDGKNKNSGYQSLSDEQIRKAAEEFKSNAQWIITFCEQNKLFEELKITGAKSDLNKVIQQFTLGGVIRLDEAVSALVDAAYQACLARGMSEEDKKQAKKKYAHCMLARTMLREGVIASNPGVQRTGLRLAETKQFRDSVTRTGKDVKSMLDNIEQERANGDLIENPNADIATEIKKQRDKEKELLQSLSELKDPAIRSRAENHIKSLDSAEDLFRLAAAIERAKKPRLQ